MAEQIQNPIDPGVPTPPPSASKDVQEQPRSGSRRMLVLFSIVLLFAVVLLAAGGYVYFTSNQSSGARTQYTQAIPTSKPTQTPTPTPLSTINKSGDLDSALNEVNDTDDSELQSDLDLANSEGSNF